MVNNFTLYRILMGIFLLTLPFFVYAEPPTDGDVNRLINAARAQQMLTNAVPQIKNQQQLLFKQILDNPNLDSSKKVQIIELEKKYDQIISNTLSWKEMRPLYVETYKQHFTKQEVVAIAEFYESDAGQALLDKTPDIIQSSTQKIQQRIQPIVVNLEKEFKQIMSK